MTGYKGKVIFSKIVSSKYGNAGAITVWHGTMADLIADGKCPDYLAVASIDVDVQFSDTRDVEIAILEKQVETERADSQQKINHLLSRIQELRAIEAPSTNEESSSLPVVSSTADESDDIPF